MRIMIGTLTLALASLAGCQPDSTRSANSGDAVTTAGLAGRVTHASATVQDSAPLIVRRVWFASDGLDFWGGPSPDARYVTFVDWETDDLAVHDFSTGENRHLTNIGSLPDSGMAVTSAFSPDGKLVAYGWEKKYDELRLINFDGSDPRVLYSNPELNVDPQEWTADGTTLLVSAYGLADRVNQIGLVSVASGSLRVLATLDQRAPFETSISPDGRYVIYDFPAESGSAEHDIFVINVGTGDTRVLVDHPADDRVLGWTPDGNYVLFASDRSGTLGAWLLPVTNGRASGDPRLVKHELWRVRPLGFARNGAFVYGVPMNMPDAYVATMDVETGKLLSPPTRVSNSYFGRNGGLEWSPDGRYLAFVSSRSALRNNFGSDAIVVRSVETGEFRELRPNIGAILDVPHWSPDLRSFLVLSSDEMNRRGLFRVDALTGDVEPVVYNAAGEYLIMGNWLGDGERLVVSVVSEDGTRLSVRDVATGEETVLYRGGEGRGTVHPRFDVSADGRQVAFVVIREDRGKSLLSMSTSGGEPRELFSCDRGDPWPQAMRWSHDGRFVYFVLWGYPIEDPRRGLWRVPAAGGEPEQLDWYMEVKAKQVPSFHPDGRQIAFTVSEFGSEVWVMENLLPGMPGRSDDK